MYDVRFIKSTLLSLHCVIFMVLDETAGEVNEQREREKGKQR